MTKEPSLNQIVSLVDYLTILFKSVSDKSGFKHEIVGNRLYIYGLSNDLAALYLLLQNNIANLLFYMGHDNRGGYIEVLDLNR